MDVDHKYHDAILHYNGSTSTNNSWWEPVGQMNVSRGYHAVSLVNDVCPSSTSATTSTTWIIVGTALVVVIIVIISVVVVVYRRKVNPTRQGKILKRISFKYSSPHN